MIPKTFEEFRALMGRARDTAYSLSCVRAEEGERVRAKMDYDALRALATSTPEQLLGIVGEVDCAADWELRALYHVIVTKEHK